MITYIAVFIALMCGSYLFTKLLIQYAIRHQLLDIANHRSSHKTATPRMGGVSFVLLISTSILISALFIQVDQRSDILIGLLLPCAIVAITAFIDDIKSLPQSQRFLAYFLASTIAVFKCYFEISAEWIIIGFIFLAVIAMTWLINLFNFMDGIDGIAATQAIFLLAALSFFALQQQQHTTALELLLYIAPILGFLLLNWQPAKIFMGDAGSTFLGCLLGCLLLMAAKTYLNLYSAVILMGCFLVDATWTLLYRILTKQIWYEAHRSHCYQILSRKLNSHSKVTLLYAAVNLLWILPWAMCAQSYAQYGLLFTTICFLPLLLVCFIMGAGQKASN